jgi:hypothetical protein
MAAKEYGSECFKIVQKFRFWCELALYRDVLLPEHNAIRP